MNIYSTLDLLLLVCALLCVPLCLRLLSFKDREGKESLGLKIIWGLYPIAAICFFISVKSEIVLTAGNFAIPWFAFTCLLALLGLTRLLSIGFDRFDEVLACLGLMYAPIGGYWFVASRFGYQLFDYYEPFVSLTAVHFHFVGIFIPILMSIKGREFKSDFERGHFIWKTVSFLFVVAVPILLFGLAYESRVERVAESIMIVTIAMFCTLSFLSFNSKHALVNKALLFVSSVSGIIAMVFGGIYLLSEHYHWNFIKLEEMVVVYGVPNIVGFALCGLLARNIDIPQRRMAPLGVPFSRLKGWLRIGDRYFDNQDTIDSTVEPPRGLVDSFSELERSDMNRSYLDAQIVDFYENTKDYDIKLKTRWNPLLFVGIIFYKIISSLIRQFNFPISPKALDTKSSFVRLKDSKDGRDKVRAWIRRDAQKNKPILSAAYSNHRYEDEAFLNVAFPLPFCNLASILRFEVIPTEGLLLTTKASDNFSGDEGVYLVTPVLKPRLPFNETIRIWAKGQCPLDELSRTSEKNTSLLARHELFLMGIRFLKLDYLIQTNR